MNAVMSEQEIAERAYRRGLHEGRQEAVQYARVVLDLLDGLETLARDPYPFLDRTDRAALLAPVLDKAAARLGVPAGMLSYQDNLEET